MQKSLKTIGRLGESEAEAYLRANEFTIIERNFACKGGEIDLIAEKNNELYFIEVKKRTNQRFGDPFFSITPEKKRRLILASQYYLLKHQQWDDKMKSISAIIIDGAELEFIPQAIFLEDFAS